MTNLATIILMCLAGGYILLDLILTAIVACKVIKRLSFR